MTVTVTVVFAPQCLGLSAAKRPTDRAECCGIECTDSCSRASQLRSVLSTQARRTRGAGADVRVEAVEGEAEGCLTRG
eukprot:1073164-Rhodomonas_salina.1